MYKSVKYRIYPNKKQKELIDKNINNCRLVYNLALECKIFAWKTYKKVLSRYDLNAQLPQLKNEYTWLKDTSSQSLQMEIKHLDDGFTRFFNKLSDFPKFKKKSTSGTFSIPQNTYLKDNKVIIPKFQEGIKIIIHRNILGKIVNSTITKQSNDKYFISISYKTAENNKTKPSISIDNTIGIDLGIKSFIVDSNSKIIENPKFYEKSQNRLIFINRKFSKYKGKRSKYRLRKIHEKIVNQRNDFLHKTSIKLIRNNQSIAIESLQVKNMLRNHKLAKCISDASWGKFIHMLEYKSDWNGVNLLKIGIFEPSSKTCSNCGYINKELQLKDRTWNCNSCNTSHDRDINAAINIKNIALKQLVSGIDTKIQNELSSIEEVMTFDA